MSELIRIKNVWGNPFAQTRSSLPNLFGPELGCPGRNESFRIFAISTSRLCELRTASCRRASGKHRVKLIYNGDLSSSDIHKRPQNSIVVGRVDANGSAISWNGVLTDSDSSDEIENETGETNGSVASKSGLSQQETFQVWATSTGESTAFGAKEPVYQVLEVNPNGEVQKKEVSRRQLLKSSGLRQRDVRRVDPSLWVTNSTPALLVRDNAILVNLGSLRAITTHDSVLIFDYASVGGQMFLSTLLERLKLDADASSSGAITMPFELEVLESALIARTQRLENALMGIEPKVEALLEQLPTHLNANALEELRLAKQALVELGSKAGALRQMLLELLEHPSDLRRIAAMGANCTWARGKGEEKSEKGELLCSTVVDKALAEDPLETPPPDPTNPPSFTPLLPLTEEEQEVEMLLEYYLQRCDFVHGQAEKLLDSAKEMEDSISVNLSSRRLEVSRLELLLQMGAFAAALGAMVAGIFGMNLRSRLEESTAAFWYTTWGIVLGGVFLFLSMYFYLKRRRIL